MINASLSRDFKYDSGFFFTDIASVTKFSMTGLFALICLLQVEMRLKISVLDEMNRHYM